ncbi:hypothetical protein BT96DRAFT_1017623 [Gymnopus androsaceus JB14]|uniref:Uncharacterized protein n=1 Tax=Gymnopus androsaceus JB14 TaxID=1447944 RepID=A0A6A4HX26_9AGAR|nr:hypothetical protein BT96DRAFT_1017623 [Gymnopus androsaceus JB14]
MPAHKLTRRLQKKMPLRRPITKGIMKNTRSPSMSSNQGRDDYKDASPPGRLTHRHKKSGTMQKSDGTSKLEKPAGFASSKDSPAARSKIPGPPIKATETLTLQPALPTQTPQASVAPCSLHTQSPPHVAQYHPDTYERTLGLQLAKQSLEAYYDSYVKGLGGNWTHFFNCLSNSFIKTGNPDEIDKAFDDNKRSEICLAKRFRKAAGGGYHVLADYEANKGRARDGGACEGSQ